VEQAPDKNRSRDEKKPERLIAPEDAALFGSARSLVGLLLERLDAGLNHVFIAEMRVGRMLRPSTPQYRGTLGSSIAM
jgi:hypothetical protein